MIVRIDLAAGGAGAAGVLSGPVRTVEPFGKGNRRGFLAHAAGAIKQIGMGHPLVLAGGFQVFDGAMLSDNICEGQFCLRSCKSPLKKGDLGGCVFKVNDIALNSTEHIWHVSFYIDIRKS